MTSPLRFFLVVVASPLRGNGCGEKDDGNPIGEDEEDLGGGGGSGGGGQTSCPGAGGAVTAQPDSTHPWPMFHGKWDHTGYAAVQGPQTGTLKWRFQAVTAANNNADIGSVAVGSDGTVYVGGGNKLFALDSSGNKKWEYSSTSSHGPAIAADGTIYFLSNESLVSLNSSGTKLWQFDTDDSAIFGPTVGTDETVYFGSWDHFFYAVKSDGTLKWKYETAGCVSYPPTLDENSNTIYLGGGDAHCGEDGNIYAFSEDGTLKWKYDTETLRVGSPAIGPDGTTYVGNSKGVFTAIDPDTCAAKWTFDDVGNDSINTDEPAGLISFPVCDQDGTCFIGATDNKMYAVDSDGNLKWSYTTGGHPSESSPALGADGTLYFTSGDGYLYAIGD